MKRGNFPIPCACGIGVPISEWRRRAEADLYLFERCGLLKVTWNSERMKGMEIENKESRHKKRKQY
jgi:hypothetical protein